MVRVRCAAFLDIVRRIDGGNRDFPARSRPYDELVRQAAVAVFPICYTHVAGIDGLGTASCQILQ